MLQVLVTLFQWLNVLFKIFNVLNYFQQNRSGLQIIRDVIHHKVQLLWPILDIRDVKGVIILLFRRLLRWLRLLLLFSRLFDILPIDDHLNLLKDIDGERVEGKAISVGGGEGCLARTGGAGGDLSCQIQASPVSLLISVILEARSVSDRRAVQVYQVLIVPIEIEISQVIGVRCSLSSGLNRVILIKRLLTWLSHGGTSDIFYV